MSAVTEQAILRDTGAAKRLGVQEAFRRLDDLNLTMVKAKLCDPVAEEGKGWAAERADTIEREYRRFLMLHLLAPSEPVVPSRAVDEFWHAHILDTEAYIRDTQALFGRVLHHNPYFGRGGAAEANVLNDEYRRTLARYRVVFGTPPHDVWGNRSGPTCHAYPPGPPPPGPLPPGPPPRCSSH